MNEKIKKINRIGGYPIGALIGLWGIVFSTKIIFTICAVILFLTCLCAFLSALKKNEILELLTGFFGSLMIGSIGYFLWEQYWNENAILIGKIGFIILVGFFFISSLLFSLIFAIAFLKKLKENLKYNKENPQDSLQSPRDPGR